MMRPTIELKNIPAEENFAVAVLNKQKECLVTWIDYLNEKEIHIAGERKIQKEDSTNK